MTTYIRESDNTEMLEIAPSQFVNANYLTGNPVFEDESASSHIDHPNNRARHAIAAQIRAYNERMGFTPANCPDWNW